MEDVAPAVPAPAPARPLRPAEDPAADAPPGGREVVPAAAPRSEEVEAVLPDRPVQRRDAPVAPAERTAREGDIACGRCSTPNEPGLAFCRHCGNPLGAIANLTVEGGGERGGWFGKWYDKLRGRLPATPAGPPCRANGSTAKGCRGGRGLFRVGLVGGVGVAALAMIHPSLRPKVLDAVKDGLPGDPYRVVSSDGYEVVVVPEGSAVADRGPELVVDRAKNTSWASEWVDPFEGIREVPAEGGCIELPSGATAALKFVFEDESDLGRLRIVPGRWAEDQARANHVRPALVELRYSDGTCEQVQLDDEGEEQAHPISADGVTEVELRILGVYRETPDTEVAITEVAFDRGR